jgi:hypothetical protein
MSVKVPPTRGHDGAAGGIQQDGFLDGDHPLSRAHLRRS